MNPKLVWVGAVLIVVGVILVAATVYQELVEEPQFPEDYHMTPQPIARYEWHSRNLAITVLGLGFIIFGIAFFLVGLWKPR